MSIYFKAFFVILECLYGVGTYKNGKKLKTNAVAGTNKFHIKCNCIDASFIGCIRKGFI